MRGLLFAALLCPLFAQAGPARAKIYEKNSQRAQFLFEFERVERQNGASTFIGGVYRDPNQTVAVEDEAEVVGGALRRYSLRQHQLDEHGEVTVEGQRIRFTYSKAGQVETSTEDLPDNLAVAPTLLATLFLRREALFKGENVKLRYAVLDRRETVGFGFTLTEEHKQGNEEHIVVKMKPSSVFVSALVDPIYFTLRKKDFTVVQIKGRTLPKQKVDGAWKDLDAEIVYY